MIKTDLKIFHKLLRLWKFQKKDNNMISSLKLKINRIFKILVLMIILIKMKTKLMKKCTLLVHFNNKK